MKITINTKEDSKEEIRKVISLLSTLVKEDINSIHSNTDLFSASKNIFSETRANVNSTSDSPATNNDFQTTTNNSTTTDSSSNQNAFANMFNNSSDTTPGPTFNLASLSNLRKRTEEPVEKEDVRVVSY